MYINLSTLIPVGVGVKVTAGMLTSNSLSTEEQWAKRATKIKRIKRIKIKRTNKKTKRNKMKNKINDK